MRSPAGRLQAARYSRCTLLPGAGYMVEVPSRVCLRWTSPLAVVMSSSSPANVRPKRPFPVKLSGGKWTSPAGLHSLLLPSSVKNATVPGSPSIRSATRRLGRAVLSAWAGSWMAAASNCALSGNGKGMPSSCEHGHTPSSSGAWPAQRRILPAFVTSCSPVLAHAAPTMGPWPPTPSSANGCASTSSVLSLTCGTSAPNP
mmetsp:Transcript_132985/g.370722  ORF Transcript_132985/g.370722 Transcript_132985/m.370722 type:complete len:201 (-) Transcript_132985:2086-2688(-)